MKKALALLAFLMMYLQLTAQNAKPKVYDETINPMEQIDKAIARAKAENKNVICQVGGNWCRWCLMFADFIKSDSIVNQAINDNYVYIHVNFARKDAGGELDKRLACASRFGFPALVVLDAEGKVRHIQDSSFLEEGEGYNEKKVLRFLNNWTPQATK